MTIFHDYIDQHQDELIRDLQGCLRIPSVYTDDNSGHPYGQPLRDCLDYTLQLCRDLGFEAREMDGHVGWCEYGEGVMSWVGGLIGRVDSDASVTIENCTVAGTIKMNGTKCGGLIGSIEGGTAAVTVKNCTNKINIAAVDNVGGIAGYKHDDATLTVENFKNEGTLVTTGEGSIAKDDKVPANPAA